MTNHLFGRFRAGLSIMAIFASALVFASASDVKVGEWTANFNAAKSRADEEGIPLLIFWGNPGCAYCNKMKAAFETTEFKTWQTARKILMAKVEGDLTVKAFVKNSSGHFPYMCVYWNRGNETVIKRCFSGRSGEMPIKSGTLARQLIDSVELDIADFVADDYRGGKFIVPNQPGNRLEAEIGRTTYVEIPLYREKTGDAVNRLVGGGVSTNLIWLATETKKTFRYILPTNTTEGTIEFALYDSDENAPIDKTAITCTNRANSIRYPYWIGERTATSLAFGEWTMDLNVAKEKAKTESGWVLLNLGGDLWCPDCMSIADTLYDDDRFKDWAMSNKVALVSIDVPRTRENEEASLLTYVAGGNWGKSGAFYRSSKMISDAQAQATLNQNWEFATNVYKLASSPGWRVSVPVMVLLRADGSTVGHFMAKEGKEGSVPGIYPYDTDENLARLNELLALAGQPGGQDNEAHRDSSTTKLVHTIGDETSDVTLQINDNAWFYRLSGFAAGKILFEATTEAGKPTVSLELFTTSSTYGDSSKKTLATGTNRLICTLDAEAVSHPVYLRIGAYPNATGSDTRGKDTYSFTNASSLFCTRVASRMVLVPQQVSQTYEPTGTTIFMELMQGATYRLSGISADSLARFFTPTSTAGLYIAKAGHDAVELTVDPSASVIAYQLWKPGVVQFTQATDRKMENEGSGTVSVTRMGGSSGNVSVNVSVDAGSLGTGRVSVSPTTLFWKEGDASMRTLTYLITPKSGYAPDEVFTFTLGADDVSVLGTSKTFSLTVTDTDKPVLASDAISVDAYLRAPISQAYPVFNIQGDGKLTLKKNGKFPSGLKLTYDKKTRSVILSGAATKTGTYTASATLSERRNGKASEGPATTFHITIRNPASSTDMAGVGIANALYGQPLSQEIPLINSANGRMEGILTLSVSANNRVSARYTGLSGKVSFSGTVDCYDAETGSFSASLAKKTSTCAVRISTNGSIAAEVFDSASATRFSSEVPVSQAMHLSKYTGSYTVTFPRAQKNLSPIAAGTAYVTLTITDKGVARYTGVMPNGKTLTGRTKIIATENGALVPILKIAAGNAFSALLNILPDAKTQYENGNPAIVVANEGSTPFWLYAKDDTSSDEELKAYGGYWSGSLNVEDACHTLYAKNVFTLDFETNALTPSENAVAATPSADVRVSDSSLVIEPAVGKSVRLKLAPKTGTVSGSAYLTLTDGKLLRAQLKGTVLLGWEDCNCGETPIVPENRPFVSGTCWFTDKVNGVRMTRSIPFDLKVKTDCP